MQYRSIVFDKRGFSLSVKRTFSCFQGRCVVGRVTIWSWSNFERPTNDGAVKGWHRFSKKKKKSECRKKSVYTLEIFQVRAGHACQTHFCAFKTDKCDSCSYGHTLWYKIRYSITQCISLYTSLVHENNTPFDVRISLSNTLRTRAYRRRYGEGSS